MVIQWSADDQIYAVSRPEWGKYARTHGATYEDSVRNGQEVLQMLIDSAQVAPRDETQRQDRHDVIAAMRVLAESVPPWNQEICRELIEDGRRF